jgi:large subunit ribosomal protein L15
MKLHDLHPADGSRQPRTRVGRGIAAGKGKTAGRGTKGQKARAGGSIPPWFEGGQTPLHMRIPKLRGFKNRFRIEYEVVNVGAIGALAERGAFELEAAGTKPAKAAPLTINQDILRAVGLVRTLNKPMKILGAGEVSVPLFVVADAFTASARAKIEAAGGSVNVLEVPSRTTAALGLTRESEAAPIESPAATSSAPKAPTEAKAPRVATGKAATPKATSTKASPAKASAAKASAAKASASAETPATDQTPPAEIENPADAATDEPAPPPEAETPSGDDA